jgi:hypothetical protein
VAVPVAVSTPFTSVTLVIVGIMLMLVGFGAATASGSPLVITSTDSATKAETILFFVLIIVPPLFNFRFYFEASLLEVPLRKKRKLYRKWFPLWGDFLNALLLRTPH